MRPRSSAVLACRIIAVYLGVQALIQIISFLVVIRTLEGTSYFWASFGSRIGVAYALWVVAERLGETMARGMEEPSSGVHALVDLQAIAFTIIGVVLVVQAIPTLIEILASESPRLRDDIYFGGRFASGRGGAVAGEFVRIGLGIVLIAGARSLSEWLRRRDVPEGPPQA